MTIENILIADDSRTEQIHLSKIRVAEGFKVQTLEKIKAIDLNVL
ncbi:MAG: hypothetical protein QM533_13360 [Cytophagales bacterium]|nr:hypothetical protein [Cytophagales bacterium]